MPLSGRQAMESKSCFYSLQSSFCASVALLSWLIPIRSGVTSAILQEMIPFLGQDCWFTIGNIVHFFVKISSFLYFCVHLKPLFFSGHMIDAWSPHQDIYISFRDSTIRDKTESRIELGPFNLFVTQVHDIYWLLLKFCKNPQKLDWHLLVMGMKVSILTALSGENHPQFP